MGQYNAFFNLLKRLKMTLHFVINPYNFAVNLNDIKIYNNCLKWFNFWHFWVGFFSAFYA